MKEDTSEKALTFPPELLSELKRRILYLWEEAKSQSMKTMDNRERRIVAQEILKRVTRELFLTQPTATEEDFERCWPELRDRIFVEYTFDLAESLIIANQNRSNSSLTVSGVKRLRPFMLN